MLVWLEAGQHLCGLLSSIRASNQSDQGASGGTATPEGVPPGGLLGFLMLPSLVVTRCQAGC